MKNKPYESRKLFGYSFDWLYTDKAIAVISVILSIACWVLITLYVSQDSTSVITDVPLRINTEDVEEFHDLQLISIVSPEALSDGRVDVEVSGSIHEISRVTADDINVIAQVGNVNTSGEHSLSLAVTCPGHNVNVRIKDGYSAVRVWFDRVLPKNLTVGKVVVNGASVAEESDLIIGDYYSSIKTLSVQGPESIIEQVDSLLITADVNRELSASEVVAATVCYADAEGNVLGEDVTKWITVQDYNDIGSESGTMAGEPSADFVTVTIPIRKKAVLPINVPIKNAPAGFDVSSLKYTVTPATITLEGDIDAIDKLVSAGSFTVDGIDLSSISIGRSQFTFPLNLAAGVEELGGIAEVTVKFSVTDYVAKKYTVENKGGFGVIKANGVSADVLTDSLEVIVIGPKEQMEKISERNIKVSADMSTYDGASGQRKMPAVVEITGVDRCWAFGTYTLTVSPKAENAQ